MSDKVSNADIHALGNQVDTATVAAANASSAQTKPAMSEFATFMAAFGRRMEQVESVLGLLTPLAGEVVAAVDPSASPVLARVAALESTVATVTDKIAAAPALTAAPAAGLAGRVSQIESLVGLATAGGTAIASAVDPNAAPILARVSTVENTVEGVLSALQEVLGNKAPSSLPPPGSATTPPVS